MLYAFNENFVLPFSHDEVVHGKGSLMDKVPGDAWQKAATLRALYAFMYVHPGQEAAVHGQRVRRSGASGITTSRSTGTLPTSRCTAGLQRFVEDLNRLYAREPRALRARLRAPRVSSGSTATTTSRA